MHAGLDALALADAKEADPETEFGYFLSQISMEERPIEQRLELLKEAKRVGDISASEAARLLDKLDGYYEREVDANKIKIAELRRKFESAVIEEKQAQQVAAETKAHRVEDVLSELLASNPDSLTREQHILALAQNRFRIANHVRYSCTHLSCDVRNGCSICLANGQPCQFGFCAAGVSRGKRAE